MIVLPALMKMKGLTFGQTFGQTVATNLVHLIGMFAPAPGTAVLLLAVGARRAVTVALLGGVTGLVLQVAVGNEAHSLPAILFSFFMLKTAIRLCMSPFWALANLLSMEASLSDMRWSSPDLCLWSVIAIMADSKFLIFSRLCGAFSEIGMDWFIWMFYASLEALAPEPSLMLIGSST